jgi:hypothetical protein
MTCALFDHFHQGTMVHLHSFVQRMRGGVSGDISTEGLGKNQLDIEMYAQSQMLHTKCLMKWPKEIQI